MVIRERLLRADAQSVPPTVSQVQGPSKSAEHPRVRRSVRYAVMLGYVIALTATIAAKGIPLDRVYQASWLVAGIVAFRIDRLWRHHVRVLLDWTPLIVALLVYDMSRGIADRLGMPIRVSEPVDIERWIFHGTVPTVWLQQHLIPASGHLPWWTVLTGIVYSTHLTVPWILAAVLYVRSRAEWSRYMRRVVVLSYVGLAFFILLPAAPPWYAATHGAIVEPVRRAAGFGFGFVSLDTSTVFLHSLSNEVAAMPSLHAAFTILVAAALWPYARWRLARFALVLYPIAMAFTLVYGGEHYVIDVLAGWGCAIGTILVCRRWDRSEPEPASPDFMVTVP
ncbi:MAG: phosphatase PAP2 family protein [Nocardiaceae bacterium]|nr:phosphatase PAP2 family protein [Nocardiaceae bacterium]